MSHVFLCSICGEKANRLLTKGKCLSCKNKTLVMYPSERDPEYIKEFRRLNNLKHPTSPMLANLVVTVMVSCMVAIGWVGLTFFHDWDTTRSTIASMPYGMTILHTLPKGSPEQMQHEEHQRLAAGHSSLH
jgi:hypothetical protein